MSVCVPMYSQECRCHTELPLGVPGGCGRCWEQHCPLPEPSPQPFPKISLGLGTLTHFFRVRSQMRMGKVGQKGVSDQTRLRETKAHQERHGVSFQKVCQASFTSAEETHTHFLKENGHNTRHQCKFVKHSLSTCSTSNGIGRTSLRVLVPR